MKQLYTIDIRMLRDGLFKQRFESQLCARPCTIITLVPVLMNLSLQSSCRDRPSSNHNKVTKVMIREGA